MFNIYKCNNCGMRLIEEEIDSHKCLEIKTELIDGQEFVHDGTRLIPLSPVFQQWLAERRNTRRFNRTLIN